MSTDSILRRIDWWGCAILCAIFAGRHDLMSATGTIFFGVCSMFLGALELIHWRLDKRIQKLDEQIERESAEPAGEKLKP
jgi:hypothetical protein